jgi:hypothetical protein
VKPGYILAEYSKEGCGSRRAALPVVMMMMMMTKVGKKILIIVGLIPVSILFEILNFTALLKSIKGHNPRNENRQK